MEQTKSTNGTNVCGKRKRGNILSDIDFSNIYDVIKSFPKLKHNIGNIYFNFPIS